MLRFEESLYVIDTSLIFFKAYAFKMCIMHMILCISPKNMISEKTYHYRSNKIKKAISLSITGYPLLISFVGTYFLYLA